MNFRKYFLLISFFFLNFALQAQFLGVGRKPATIPEPLKVDYSQPKEYIIGGITVVGVKFLDVNTLISVSGLNVNDKIVIPGEKTSTAIRRLMDQGIIEDVAINITKIEENKVFLELSLTERPRLNKFIYVGIRKGEQDGINDKIKLNKGKVITNSLTKNIKLTIKKYYIEKGFLNASIQIKQIADTIRANQAAFRIIIDKKSKVKINQITVNGVDAQPIWKVLAKLKGTKQKRFARIFTPSKFVPKKYEEDKTKLIEWYNKNGYRDAQITSDTTFSKDGKSLNVVLNLNEGHRYYYRNITWKGVYLYDSTFLSKVLAIKKGDVYNPEDMNKRINGIPQADVSSQYMDKGYLYFHCDPTEVAIVGDSIDVEMRIFEGKQASINRVILNGNTKTSDHVVMRDIMTLPGQKFNKTELIETTQLLSKLGYFDPQKIDPKPIPQSDGTVDIEYGVEEKPSDNIELSGGWGGLQGFIGTFGIVFNNFSARNIGNLKKWRPLPAGDGQRLALRIQSSGVYYQTYSLSFTEPWLGGKKPNSLGVSVFYTSSDNAAYYSRLASIYGSAYSSLAATGGSFKNLGMSVTYGKRLKWPDHHFSLSGALSYQRYNVNNSYFIPNFTKGIANDISVGFTLARYDLDNPQFTRRGSSLTLSGTFNPPYSLFRSTPAVGDDRYKFIEGHKWMFDGDWYAPLVGKLVLHAGAHMGFLGKYSTSAQYSPFGHFILGGAGLGMQGTYNVGAEIIGLRGYNEGVVLQQSLSDQARLLTGAVQLNRLGGVVYSKYATEIRYPISLNPQALIFVQVFAEAGNSWGSYSDFNPFQLRRTAGIGAKIFMPAFGQLGIDFGKGFDPIPGLADKGLKSFTFSIGQQIR